MAKRGRKSFNQLSEEQKDKLYEIYSKNYDLKTQKVALTPKYSKKAFLFAYKRQHSKSKQNVIRTMITSQYENTTEQNRVWTKNIKNNINKWKKMDPSELSIEQRNVLNYLKNDKINVSWVKGRKNKEFWNYLNSLDDWKDIFGS